MRFNGAGGLRASVRARHHNPPRVEFTIGPLIFTADPDEALKLADALCDAAETIRSHRNTKGPQEE